MPTAVFNAFTLIGVASAYFFLFALMPFWLRGYKLSGENVTDHLVASFLCGNAVIILSVYLLALTGIYHRATLIILLILIAAAYLFLFRREQTRLRLSACTEFFRHLSDGYYHPRVVIGNIRAKVVLFIKKTALNNRNPVGTLGTLAIFAYGAYIRGYHSIVNLFYASSDMYLHTEWTKYLIRNEPFFSGVYPFGFHNVVASLSTVFGIRVSTVMRMLGPISGMLTVFMLYYLLRRTTRSLFAVNTALALYVVTDLFPFWATERQFLALPQEYATMFLYLTGYFLYRYMKDKKTRDLVGFSLTVSLTLLIHVFITVFAVLLCVAVFISCIAYLNRKVFIRLVAGTLCAAFVAFAPLAAGLLKGIELNGSAGWAISVVQGSTEPSDGSDFPAASPDAIEASSILEYPQKIYGELLERGFLEGSYALSLLNANWFLPYLIAVAVGLLSPMIRLRNRSRPWIYAGFSAYSFMLCALYILSHLQLFSLMEYSRLYIYFIYSIPLVACIPLELLHNFLYGTKRIAKAAYLSLAAVLGSAGILFIFAHDRFMPLGRVWQSQYNGSVVAYHKISDQFPSSQWIMVSSMSEYMQSLFEGFHYEMTDFIMDMHDYDEQTTLVLPAENVFVYVVKRPNVYLDTDIVPLDNLPVRPPFDPNDVYVDLEETYGAKKGTNMLGIYLNPDANRALQAKVDAWAREYMKYYPDEMSVFYEDDDLMVYRVRQNPYALNNFAIPYEGNKKSAASEKGQAESG